MTSKKLINDPSTCVNDAVEGCLLADQRLRRVGNLNILVRHDIEQVRNTCVSIISGGGSGHEPAHAGFIGAGMLSAAVLGNVFASPSVSAILAAIRVCNGECGKGVLLIVKNYTGDRLNFGMAMEKAKQEGISCQMVIVDDDCALQKGKGITGGRGVAGTVFVHKVAGAAAAAGRSLDEVYAEATQAVKCIGTLGVALSTCTVPGAPSSQRLAGVRTYEVGMGIHGEPGREQRELPDSNAAVVVADILVEGILGSDAIPARLEVQRGESVVLLLNNLGGLPAIEMAIVAKTVMTNVLSRSLKPVRVFMGPYMTALEMSGVSLTVVRIPANAEGVALLARIDAGSTAPAWITAPPLDFSSSDVALDSYLASRSLVYDGEQFNGTKKSSGGSPCPRALAVIEAVCAKIIDIEPVITEYDTICGDGDCGLVMKAGATRVLADVVRNAAVAQECTADSAVLCDKLADAISASMGGTSGALLEIFFRAMATHMMSKGAGGGGSGSSSGSGSGTAVGEAAMWSAAMWQGLVAMKYYGGATVGMRTMLDALEPGLAALVAAQPLTAAESAAQQGMESTKTMGSLAGRSNYVEEQRMRNIPDPGAAVVAAAFTVARIALQS